MKTSITLSLSLLLHACSVTPADPDAIALASSSAEVNTSSSDDTGVLTSTDGEHCSSSGDTSSGSTSEAGTSSSSAETTTTSDAASSSGDTGSESTTGASLASCRYGDPTASCGVFVSSGATVPDLGPEGLHDLCTDLACNADPSMGPCKKYRALIRTTEGFWEPFALFLGTYVLPSGAHVAAGVDGLMTPSGPINEDETGALVAAKESVWTGAAGLYYTCPAGNETWGTIAMDMSGTIGHVGGAEKTWHTPLLSLQAAVKRRRALTPTERDRLLALEDAEADRAIESAENDAMDDEGEDVEYESIPLRGYPRGRLVGTE